MNKIVLVTMPFIKPTSPPLGIASLKGFVEKNCNAKVKCMDINILFHHDFLDYLKSRGDLNEREKLMVKFYDFMKNKNSLEDLKKLNYNITEFLEGFENIKEKANFVAREFIEGKRKDLSLMDKYAQLIIDEKADVIGFSICYEENLRISLAMAKRIKIVNPKTKILFGGSYTSSMKEKLSKVIGKTADYIIYNQGEIALLDLVKGVSLEHIPNLIYNKEGEIITNKEEILSDLDKVPFADFSDFDLDKYFTPFPVLPVLFSKGCYWKKCSFCVHHLSYSNTYKVKKIGRFVEELGHYNKKYDVKYFYFVDEMISSVHFEKISESIIKHKLDMFYSALVKPTKDFSFDVLKKMYDSGCRCLLLGVESGNQRILDLMVKGTNVHDIETFLELSSKAGIKNYCFFILGFPSENLNELEDTKRFIIKNRKMIDLISYGKFSLEENSPVFLNPDKFGIIIKESEGVRKVYNYENINGGNIDDSVYNETKKFLSGLNGDKQCLVYLRDIMLMHYSDKNVL